MIPARHAEEHYLDAHAPAKAMKDPEIQNNLSDLVRRQKPRTQQQKR
ncbi:hypothetical protein C5167_019431 [Papaver somniferum]|uniref:Uncharacterized protein n=1 Tax=Papaver somniferum TaxID=3469 RepID=A0A4Y7ITE8_PAPSO|nr:hypothetical protein C5167_019431 [Papaver somniferum]